MCLLGVLLTDPIYKVKLQQKSLSIGMTNIQISYGGISTLRVVSNSDYFESSYRLFVLHVFQMEFLPVRCYASVTLKRVRTLGCKIFFAS